MMSPLEKTLRVLVGVFFTMNFILFWSIPIVVQGLLWKHCFRAILMPIFNYFDQLPALRSLAETYVYSNPRHADFFLTSILGILNAAVSVGIIFYWQLKNGSLPWWLIGLYYFAWVGTGGRMMGAAYALSHKEGHNRTLYKKWIRDSVGHIFENILGPMYGNVPWNFTTSHIFIHHRLDGGAGDTFYLWDLDRTSLTHFMLYIYRIALHMLGYSSLKFFTCHGHKAKADLLEKGVLAYWSIALVFIALTRSFAFVFWIYIQPFICMTYFLALINIGYHGFIEMDSNGVSIPCVNSTCIIEGDDDYFGEDDHMSHHYNTNVYFRDLPALQASKVEEFKKYHGSVFRGLSILELSIFILFQLWDKCAEHYVDYTGKMTKDEIANMLRLRATRLETTYEKYEHYLANPTPEARKALLPEIKMVDKGQDATAEAD